ncbi:class I SAM-dependent methyltransferase [Anaerotalea alkaliphila]|uniref:Methyltransferase domain-containing protein n=1 Tax=Anaerotalea alkaliphila TaxID=2662126 RepID=A0A7X5KMQ3_9FIRM|nr:class I SAM-dependent methyltransferase [Anaerotalea alkaliphila]NDL66948.1 methyltransferase domain-containing protein [Anaerotalea alkaliphila]
MGRTEETEEGRRQHYLHTDIVIEALGLDRNSKVLDVGCGMGVFSIPFAAVAKSVKAVDDSEKMIEYLSDRLEEEGIENITLVLGEFQDLSKEVFTHVFISHILHEMENFEQFREKLLELTSPGSRVGIFEWKRKRADYGPEYQERLSPEDVMGVVGSSFTLERYEELSEPFYLVVLKRI